MGKEMHMAEETKQEGKGFQGGRSRKRLNAAKEATALNREYNARMWEDIAKGEPFIFGYGPMELFNAMGLYLVLAGDLWVSSGGQTDVQLLSGAT